MLVRIHDYLMNHCCLMLIYRHYQMMLWIGYVAMNEISWVDYLPVIHHQY